MHMIDELKNELELIFSGLAKYEKDKSLPQDFFKKLLYEDDWSFVIKIHTLIEAAVSESLAAVINPKLLVVFQQLSLGDTRTGKLKFAEAFGLLNENQLKFIKLLSNIRNKLAHDIKNIDFNFSDYIANLDTNQSNNFSKVLTSLFVDENKTFYSQEVKKETKLIIWLNSVSIINSTAFSMVEAKFEKLQNKSLFMEMRLRDIEEATPSEIN